MTKAASSLHCCSDQSPRVSRVKDRTRARPSLLQAMLTAVWGGGGHRLQWGPVLVRHRGQRAERPGAACR
ncbi:hypothetical protein ACFQV4_24930 [Streptomyces thermocarboxydus]